MEEKLIELPDKTQGFLLNIPVTLHRKLYKISSKDKLKGKDSSITKMIVNAIKEKYP